MDIPDWIIDNASEFRPTEILLPVEVGVGPTWSYVTDTGGWFGRVDVALPPDLITSDTELMACDHCHPTKDGAWKCADDLARVLVERSLAMRASGGGD